jgi:hypothetical protein
MAFPFARAAGVRLVRRGSGPRLNASSRLAQRRLNALDFLEMPV